MAKDRKLDQDRLYKSKGPPSVLCTMTAALFFVLHILHIFLSSKQNGKYMEILMKPTLGKAVNKDKVIKSPLYDLHSFFFIRTSKIWFSLKCS